MNEKTMFKNYDSLRGELVATHDSRLANRALMVCKRFLAGTGLAAVSLGLLNFGSATLNAQTKYYRNEGHRELARYAFFGNVDLPHGDYIVRGDGFGYCKGPGTGHVEKEVLDQAGQATGAALGSNDRIVGLIISQGLNEIAEWLVPQTGGSIAEFLSWAGIIHQFAVCGSIAMVLPEGSTNVSVLALAFDKEGGNWADCSPDQAGQHPCNRCEDGRVGRGPCHGSWGNVDYAAWVWQINGRVVTGIFKNWSHDRERRSQFRVYFDPPARWAAAHPLDHALGGVLKTVAALSEPRFIKMNEGLNQLNSMAWQERSA
jgi:hypothetical protein